MTYCYIIIVEFGSSNIWYIACGEHRAYCGVALCSKWISFLWDGNDDGVYPCGDILRGVNVPVHPLGLAKGA